MAWEGDYDLFAYHCALCECVIIINENCFVYFRLEARCTRDWRFGKRLVARCRRSPSRLSEDRAPILLQLQWILNQVMVS